MSHRTFKVLVTVLDFCGLILLLALLLTPARRHPIVNSIVGLTICHCIFGSLPAFLWLVNPGARTALIAITSSDASGMSQYKVWRAFCLADAILMNYFTIVKSAFALSFTLPCVYLACKFTGNRDRLESQTGPQFYRHTTIALCVGPFLWALPLILELAPTLAHDPFHLGPAFVGPMCIAQNEAGQILALVLTLLPLTVAVIAAAVLLFILLKYYKLPDWRRSFAVLNPIRIIRFAALLATVIVSAVLYSLVLAVWLDRSLPQPISFSLEAWISVAALWEAMTPSIFFFIFAAHEDIYSVWWQWIRHCIPRWECAPHPYDDTVSSQGYTKAYTLRGPLRIFDWLSHPRAHSGGADEDAEQHACDSAIALSKSRTSRRWDDAATGTRAPRVFTRHIMQISYAGAPFAPSNDPRGLPPPPRHQRSRSHSPSESGPPVFRAAPSLSAIGRKRSRRAASESRRRPSPRQFLDHPPLRPGDHHHADGERSASRRGLRLTPSDDGERSKDEAASRVEEVATQFSVISVGETFESRSRSRAGGTVEGLDLTGTFGVICPDSG